MLKLANPRHRFFGMVKSVMAGERPVNSVNEPVMAAVHKHTPRDPSEHAVGDGKLPAVEDQGSKSAALGFVLFSLKCASARSHISRVEKAVHRTAEVRRKQLEAHVKKLEQSNEQLRAYAQGVQDDASKQVQDASAQAQQAGQAASQAASQAAAVPPMAPAPPSAQTPYGSMLTGAQPGQPGQPPQGQPPQAPASPQPSMTTPAMPSPGQTVSNSIGK